MLPEIWSKCARWYFPVYTLISVFKNILFTNIRINRQPLGEKYFQWVRVGQGSLYSQVLCLTLGIPPKSTPAMLYTKSFPRQCSSEVRTTIQNDPDHFGNDALHRIARVQPDGCWLGVPQPQNATLTGFCLLQSGSAKHTQMCHGQELNVLCVRWGQGGGGQNDPHNMPLTILSYVP